MFVFLLSVLFFPIIVTVGINTLNDQSAFSDLNPNVSALAMLVGYLLAYGLVLYFARDYLRVIFDHLFSNVSIFQMAWAIFIGSLFTLAIALVMILIPPPAEFHGASEELAGGTLISRTILVLFIAALGPIIEEFVFRGYIFDSLSANNSFGTTALATSLLFTIPHLPDYYIYWPAGFVMFTLGMLLAYFRKKHDSLLPCILLHASYNSGLLLLFFASELS